MHHRNSLSFDFSKSNNDIAPAARDGAGCGCRRRVQICRIALTAIQHTVAHCGHESRLQPLHEAINKLTAFREARA